MATLRDILDYDNAPLKQWEPVVCDGVVGAKALEDEMTHSAIVRDLKGGGYRNVTGIIADEARLELRIANEIPSLHKVTHLTLSGAFEASARMTLDSADACSASKKVSVETDVNAVPPNSQDIVLLNMIMGCVSFENDHSNVEKLAAFAAALINEGGRVLVVAPNPGSSYDTYHSVENHEDIEAGKDYSFTVDGLDNYEVMKNLYTPPGFLKSIFSKAGLSQESIIPIHDSKNRVPFILTSYSFT